MSKPARFIWGPKGSGQLEFAAP
uniref:Uncharacterized protein n=1 Tax=Rhizophora mucronata TaxID=61149 RepID=A0A2P2NBA6_RHIMU